MNDNIIKFRSQRHDKPPENPPDSGENGPILNIPPVTLALSAVIWIIYAFKSVFSDTTYENVIVLFSFIPERLTTAGIGDLSAYITVVTYMFLHGNFIHIAMNGAMLIAVGSGVEKIVGKLRYTVFFFLCGICAVTVQYLCGIHSGEPLIGASGAISGLFGGTMFYMFKTGRMSGGLRGLASVTLVWTAVNILLGLIGIPGDNTVSVAWVAHLGGFYSGLALFPYFLKRI